MRLSGSTTPTKSPANEHSLSPRAESAVRKARAKGLIKFPGRCLLPGKKSKEDIIFTVTSSVRVSLDCFDLTI